MMETIKNMLKCSCQSNFYETLISLLTGQIDVEKTDRNYRLENIESTMTCKHLMKEMTGYYCGESDS